MNPKKIIGIILILAFFGLGFYLSKKGNNTGQGNGQTQVASGNQNPTAATVQYSDNGFSPATITVKKGTSVTFVNNSSAPMWVASNPHPTHTDLPGFDQLSAADNGGTYSYTFQKTGSWGYHNHRSPGDTGTVVVTE